MIQTTGTCKQCKCNNNTDICDPISGVCKDCGYNTTGIECEQCLDGFFGDASMRNCSGRALDSQMMGNNVLPKYNVPSSFNIT